MSRAHALTQLPPPLPKARPAGASFASTLKQVVAPTVGAQPSKPRLSAVAVVSSAPTAHGAGTVAVARGRVDAEASRLSATRTAHQATAQGLVQARQTHDAAANVQVDERSVELLVAELDRCLGPAAAEKPSQLPFAVVTPPPAQAPVVEAPREPPTPIRALQAIALVERIELFMKEQRPALALTLNNALAATVELEKLGPGTVAVTIKGKLGPPTPEMVSRLRDELRERGLKLGALSIG